MKHRCEVQVCSTGVRRRRNVAWQRFFLPQPAAVHWLSGSAPRTQMKGAHCCRAVQGSALSASVIDGVTGEGDRAPTPAALAMWATAKSCKGYTYAMRTETWLTYILVESCKRYVSETPVGAEWLTGCLEVLGSGQGGKFPSPATGHGAPSPRWLQISRCPLSTEFDWCSGLSLCTCLCAGAD